MSESEDPTLTHKPRDEANQVLIKSEIKTLVHNLKYPLLHVPCQPITPKNIHEFVHVGNSAPQQR